MHAINLEWTESQQWGSSQSNALFKCLHGIHGTMLYTAGLEGMNGLEPTGI